MKTESITQKQAVCIVALFTIGSSIVLGVSRNSRQDSWMAILAALAAAMPILYIYARILNRYPGMDLFEICIALFGKVVGRVIIVLFAWYAFHLGALVLRNFSEFIQITTFDQMPQSVSLLCMIVLVIWVSRKGIEVLGRWSAFALPILLTVLVVTIALLVRDMHPSNLTPVGENIASVPADAWSNFTFPFAETVLFLCVLDHLKRGASPGKVWLWGVLIGGAALLSTLLRNVMTLGFPTHSDAYFPSYEAVSIIIAGSFLSRIENVVGANLLLSGFMKISVCLIVASKGVTRLVGAKDYRTFAAPLGLLMAAFAGIVYQSTMEMYDFIDVYKYYALPFELFLPILVCIAAEIKMLVKKKKEQPT
jgi:spore germination protein KB